MSLSIYLRQILDPIEHTSAGNPYFEAEACQPLPRATSRTKGHEHYLAHFKTGMTAPELAAASGSHYSSARAWLKKNAFEMKEATESGVVRWAIKSQAN